MGNMSYCRWENTYGDLLDCLESIEDDWNRERHENMYDTYSYNKNGGREWRAKKNMIHSILNSIETLKYELRQMTEYEEMHKEEEE